jgi:hypothetical protein
MPFVSSRKLHSLWHGGEVARFNYKDFDFIIEARGYVKAELQRKTDGINIAYIKDSNNCGAFETEMQRYFKTDADLHKLLECTHEKYTLNLIDGNEWTCTVEGADIDSTKEIRDTELDSDNLLEAIAEAIINADALIEYACAD